MRNPVAAWRSIREMEEAGYDADELHTEDLLSVFAAAAAVAVVGLGVAAVTGGVLAAVGLLAGCTGVALAIHLTIPLAPRLLAYLTTWRYPR
ncbi:hypothetical protein [Salarchaeum japonicum]|nr:hypothetical protein [Salarchaeum japonicum]